MTPRGIGIALFFVAAILAFVAWERYDQNARDVRAVQDNPLAKGLTEMLGGKQALEPAVPTATKYALVFGAAALLGGFILVRRPRAD